VRRWALIVLLVGLAAVPTGSSAPVHYPADNGWIAFSSDRDINSVASFRLYRLAPIGGRVDPIGQLRGRHPAWSPDGSLTAFVDLDWQLVVARADGRRVRRLTRDQYLYRDPAWSPDGSRIVLTRFAPRRAAGDIVVVNVATGQMQRLTRTWQDDSEPAWSPDGSVILFVSNRIGEGIGDRELHVIRPDGRRLRQLTFNDVEDVSPAWSPDGSLIAFVSGRKPGQFNPELWTMRADGSDERRVQPAAAPGGFPSWADEEPSWSPDGQWLVYVTNETNDPVNIFIVRPDGSGKTDLTPETRSQELHPAWQPVCSHRDHARRNVVRGGATDDRLCGFAGNDTLVGGAGRDGLYGGEGNGVIRARDGSFDVVGCGAGRDEVVADRVDLVGVDCERIRRA
jgi:Tol biopolymer transport system component